MNGDTVEIFIVAIIAIMGIAEFITIVWLMSILSV